MKKQLILILVLSIAVHFAFFGRPNETVFDEVHFGKFISAYYTGEYYFDIHPPLGKLMIAGFAKIVDFKPQYNFTDIGNKFPDNKYLILRLLPAVAGTILPVIIYMLILELGMSRMAAFAGGLLIVFDNALLTQSRLILLDSFLLLFGFTSLLFYFKYFNSHHRQKQQKHHSQILKNLRMMLNWNLFWMAVFGGMAISIKWTALSFIALPVLIEAYYKFIECKGKNSSLKPNYLINSSYVKFVKHMTRFCSFFLVSLAIYFSVFVLHFALLPKPGTGDAFMKPGFREQSVIKNILNLNIEMYRSNQRITASHPYSSQWYTWPFMAKPIYYWVKDSARIYFFGNPVVWWASTIAVAIGLWTMAYGLWLKFRKYSKLSSIVHSPLAFLLGGYLLNLLPFVGIKRVMFLYHYLTALMFAIILLVFLIDKLKNRRNIFTSLIIASAAIFLFFAPLSYGLPLSEKFYEARVWFANWR